MTKPLVYKLLGVLVGGLFESVDFFQFQFFELVDFFSFHFLKVTFLEKLCYPMYTQLKPPTTMIHRFDVSVTLGSESIDMPIAIDDEHNELYVNTGVSGVDNDGAVMLSALYDGVKTISAQTTHRGRKYRHTLVPLSWIEREYGSNPMCQFRAYKARIFSSGALEETKVTISPSTIPILTSDPSVKPSKGFAKRK